MLNDPEIQLYSSADEKMFCPPAQGQQAPGSLTEDSIIAALLDRAFRVRYGRGCIGTIPTNPRRVKYYHA
jgi:hypothetical protein